MKNKLAIFDFDGTLTTKDTMFEFLIFSFGKPKLYMGLLHAFPDLVLLKLKLADRQKTKEKFLYYFFKDLTLAQLNARCEAYTPEIDKVLRPEAIKRLEWHQQNGDEVYIVSASLENWVAPWAKKRNVKLLATQLNTDSSDHITKEFRSKNCYGKEKVDRIFAAIPNATGYEIYAYGDSGGDRDILELAQHKYYRKFE